MSVMQRAVTVTASTKLRSRRERDVALMSRRDMASECIFELIFQLLLGCILILNAAGSCKGNGRRRRRGKKGV